MLSSCIWGPWETLADSALLLALGSALSLHPAVCMQLNAVCVDAPRDHVCRVAAATVGRQVLWRLFLLMPDPQAREPKVGLRALTPMRKFL